MNRGGLTQAQRDALPDSAFAIPSRRAFPTHDQQHALWAIEDAQTATPADQAKVLAAAFWRYPHLRQVWASMRARHTQHKPTAAPISTGGRPTPRGSRQ